MSMAIMQLLKFESALSMTVKNNIMRSVKNPALLKILKRLLPPPPVSAPAVGEQFLVEILSADSPDSFVVRDVRYAEDMDRLRRDMNKFYKCRPDGLSIIDSAQQILAVYSGSDGWRRGVVEGMVGDRRVVRLLDYGGREVLDRHHLTFPLDGQFMKLPCQALTGRLGRVTGRLSGGQWGEESRAWFKNRVVGRQFTAVVMKKYSDNEGDLNEVEFVLCDEDTLEKGQAVQDEMVFEGLADRQL